MSKEDIARQYYLFCEGDQAQGFNEIFQKEIGLRIQDFIGLYFSLCSHFLTKNNEEYAPATFLSALKEHFTEETIELFWSSISLDTDQAADFIKQEDAVFTNAEHQLWEQTALRRYPLLRYYNRYYPYSKPVLYYAAQNNVFDILKKADSPEICSSIRQPYANIR